MLLSSPGYVSDFSASRLDVIQGCLHSYGSETVLPSTDSLLQTWDAFDFFTVSLTASDLAETFDKSVADITWGITLVLMFRSVGSILFGIAADRYGRKWPFIVNNILFMVLELVSGINSFAKICIVSLCGARRESLSSWAKKAYI